jgi:pimeloyl-ACP methyl ester carboxylesterase
MPKTPANRQPHPFRITTDPATLGLISRHLDTAFGRQHVVAPAQPRHTEAMLFLHGFGSNWTVWTPLLQAAGQAQLLPNIDPILVDLPGFGASQNNLAHLNSQQVADMLIELVHRLGYRRLRVAGHSMGGFFGARYGGSSPRDPIRAFGIKPILNPDVGRQLSAPGAH